MGYMLLQALINGILLGSVYGAVALGLSLAFGVMGIINWAHGEMLMVAMFLSYALVTYAGMNPYLTVIPVVIVMFAFGYGLQKFVFARLFNKAKNEREPLSVLLTTAGLGMILWNVATMIFGSDSLQAKTTYLGKTFWIGDNIMISIPSLISFIIACVATFGLYWFLEKTDEGRAIRATSQNREVASLMGISIENIFCISFGFSLALVGIAGVLLIPNYPVFPKVGGIYGIKAFMIVVLGGKGNVKGALFGGILVGIIERITAILWSESYGLIMTFVLFIVILLFKPNGLFTPKRA